MVRKRKAGEPQENHAALTQRIKHLCDLEWEGYVTRMAADLSISHPVMSRVLAGDQPPPTKLLVSLARRPKINIRWVMSGLGEPLHEGHAGRGSGCFAPLANKFLLGPPDEHPEGLSGATLPVPEAFASATVYWVRLAGDDPLVKAASERVQAGDHLLVECSTEWTQRGERLEGRLVVVRSFDKKQKTVLARVAQGPIDYYEQPHLYELTVFGQPMKVVLDTTPAEAGKDRPRRDRRTTSDKSTPQGETSPRLGIEDVVGVCILLMRLW